MTTFAATFRELVGPCLRQRCRRGAFCVERGRWTFTQAHCFVWDLACARGACHLPPPVLSDLADWIDCEILTAAMEFEASETSRRAIVDEMVGQAVVA